ncbi:hypothetical protein Tco_0745742 [Tanacetum coccineum]
MGELTFFLGLQGTQKDDGIFISQDKYMDEILKKFGFSTVKTASTPMETSKPLMKDENILEGQPKLGLWYPKDSPFDLEAYTDSDYAGASLDRKSTTRGCQFLGSILISWQCTINRTQSLTTLNEPIPQRTSSGSGPRRQDTILGDIPAQTRVLALENIKTAQDLEITNLKKRVKKLETKKKSRTSQLKRRIFKVRIESSAEKSLGDQEEASNQGRSIAEIDQDEGISCVPVTTASPTRPVDDSITDDITLAETLMKIKSSASRP